MALNHKQQQAVVVMQNGRQQIYSVVVFLQGNRRSNSYIERIYKIISFVKGHEEDKYWYEKAIIGQFLSPAQSNVTATAAKQ